MMNLNKRELKSISYDFRCIASRLHRASHHDFGNVLKMFINCIDTPGIINDYINGCKRDDFDVAQEVKEVRLSSGRAIFDLGDTAEEEIFTIYWIFKHVLSDDIKIVDIADGYSSSGKYQEMLSDFNSRVTLVFINHIEAYLTKIGIEMGYDEDVNYMITVNGGQVNIAKNQSTINAVQNNGIDTGELMGLVESIKQRLDKSIPDEEREMIEQNIETIQSELRTATPKKSLVKTCIMGLKTTIVALPTAIALAENVWKFIKYVEPIVAKIGG